MFGESESEKRYLFCQLVGRMISSCLAKGVKPDLHSHLSPMADAISFGRNFFGRKINPHFLGVPAKTVASENWYEFC